jgi:hypothetical protein
MVNITRTLLVTLLMLLLFTTAKSFIAAHNVDQWAEDVRTMLVAELAASEKRLYPSEFYFRRIEAIQKQWAVMRYVSVASALLCIGTIILVSRKK